MQKLFEKNRYRMFIPVSIMMFTTGFPSIWSVFQADPVARYGITLDRAAMLFPMCTAFYGLFYIVGGKLSEKFDNRICAMAGTCIMCMGILDLALLGSGTSVITLVLLFSLPFGAGCGIIFPNINPPFLRWFIDKGGFAYGFVCAGCSILSMGMTYVSNFLLNTFGMQKAVIFIAAAYFVVSIASCFSFVSPTAEFMNKTLDNMTPKKAVARPVKKMVDFSTKEMLSTKQYYLLLSVGIFSAPRYMLIGPSRVTLGISRGLSEGMAVTMVAASMGVSAIAQLVVPSVSDKTGRKPALAVMLSVVLAASIILSFGKGGRFMAAFLALVFSNSAWAVMLMPFSNDLFGLKYSGTNSGFINMYNTITAFSLPLVLSAVSMLCGDMARHVIAVAGCTVGLICLLLIDTDTAKLKTRRKKAE